MITKHLDEGWILHTKSGDYPSSVPCSVLSVLLGAGAIPDPYFGENEYAVRELLANDVIFTQTFTADAGLLDRAHQILRFECLDTLASVRLNGTEILSADNQHRIWEADVRGILGSENLLEIRFSSALDYVRNVKPTPGKEISMVAAGAIAGNEYIRKAHSMFGWDWGAQLPDMGILRPVTLLAWDEGRIEDFRFSQSFETTGILPVMGSVSASEYRKAVEQQSEITIYGEVSYDGENSSLELTMTDPQGNVTVIPAESLQICRESNRIESLNLPSGAWETTESTRIIRYQEKIKMPQLWWPHGLGEQPLYRLTAKTIDAEGHILDEKTLTVGLRELTIDQSADAWGESFACRANGVDFFSMGADYIPEDCIYPWITKERLESLISAAAESGCNTLRVWGGGYYPSDEFYDLCDRYGICVWQDLMYACNVYDLTEHFEENIIAETKDNVRRLRHHASLLLWCGNNENETSWADWGTAEQHSPALKADYVKMFERILPKVIREEDDGHLYWPSSPSSGGCFDQPNDENRGDVHYWDVWHGMKPFTDYRHYYFRFCSEFGFQSFPDIRTIESFTNPEDRNIFSPVMESHQKNGQANGKILSYISENFRYPKNFESLIYVSQVLQAQAIKLGVEHWRRNRGRCMGSLYWQLNDDWPVASWASIDYYGRRKALWYSSRRFYAPVAGSLAVDGMKVTSCAENETMEKKTFKTVLSIMDFSGVVLEEQCAEAVVEPMSAKILIEQDFTDLLQNKTRTVFAVARFLADGEEIPYETEVFEPYKRLTLPTPALTISVKEKEKQFEVTLESDVFAPFVWLDFLSFDPEFSDNSFSLLPHCPITVTLREKAGEKLSLEEIRNSLIVRTLRDTY